MLWFEHDLYDQLQILQILDWLSQRSLGSTQISLICIDHHPSVERFLGLGQLLPHQLADLFPGRSMVTPEQTALARRAWSAFTATDPGPLLQLIADRYITITVSWGPRYEDCWSSILSAVDGLSRTESAILRAVSRGCQDTRPLLRGFVRTQRKRPSWATGHSLRNMSRLW